MADALNATALQASLTVTDLARSVAWYTEGLGFRVSRRIERDGQLRGMAIEAGGVRLLLNRDDGAKGWDRKKGLGLSFQITTTDDVDAIAARLKARGTALETEPRDFPWGARAFRVRDPDGFLLVLSRPQGATPAS